MNHSLEQMDLWRNLDQQMVHLDCCSLLLCSNYKVRVLRSRKLDYNVLFLRVRLGEWKIVNRPDLIVEPEIKAGFPNFQEFDINDSNVGRQSNCKWP